MRNWPVQYSTLLNNDATDVTKPKQVPFKVAPLPGTSRQVPGHSALGGQNLAVSAHSEQPEAAQDLIEFMTQESSQLLLARYGGFASTRQAPYDDDMVQKRYPYITQLEDAVENAELRPVSRHYAKFSKVFQNVVADAMEQGGTPPPGFADTLTAALQGR